ncbi:DgyrCDS4681 [Dimorphilus gyrociliatus]|uniref:DgyrCDS4681 n=1 Tax=Dimorphilus gyrociliatus TaxID=2664684 RepID=A0A7I8VJ54_9ANNE|nr:DgyrCDS4681 [Dimorphilus gyrociliatus]
MKENTHFKSKEIKEWHDKFKKDFPSGIIKRHEFRKIYMELTNKKSEELADYVFDAYDQDKNGVIDFKEFMITLSITCRGDIKEKLKWVFDMYDTDGSSYLSKSEVIKVLEVIFRMKGNDRVEATAFLQTVDIFKKLDKDKDGYITKEEFCRIATREREIINILNAI